MADNRTPSPLRVLAPVALVAFTLAFFAVVLSSGGSDDADSDRSSTSEQRSERRGRSGRERRRPRARGDTYTVRTGDTLAGIAARVGLSVDRLQELNPELDPQALVSGQKIKLRE